jgi:class III lanthionine synthetase
VTKGYEVYCLADPLFYDSPSLRVTSESSFAVAQKEVPDGWRRTNVDDWLLYLPDGAELPPQGWKIHASACVENAEQVVTAVYDSPDRWSEVWLCSRA